MRLALSRIIFFKPHYFFTQVFKMNRYQLLQWILPALLLLCLAGCGSPSNIGTVEGNVTLDGAPLANATVTFYPNSGERSSSGKTDENGTYTLRHTRDVVGAVIGKHVVTISIVTDGKKRIIPTKYSDRKKTDQTATVESGSNNFNFDLNTK